MILVFCIALTLLLIFLSIVLMICMSRLEIKIKNMNIKSTNKRKNNEKILMQVSLKIGKWTWLKFRLNKEKLAKLYAKIKEKEYANKIDFSNIKDRLKESAKGAFEDEKIKGLIKNTRIEIEKFNANIAVGTEDYIFTSYLVAIISTIISNILPHVIKEDKTKKRNLSNIVHYRIVPIYRERNEYNIYLTIIASTKIMHLLNILFKLMRVNKKEMNVKPV